MNVMVMQPQSFSRNKTIITLSTNIKAEGRPSLTLHTYNNFRTTCGHVIALCVFTFALFLKIHKLEVTSAAFDEWVEISSESSNSWRAQLYRLRLRWKWMGDLNTLRYHPHSSRFFKISINV